MQLDCDFHFEIYLFNFFSAFSERALFFYITNFFFDLKTFQWAIATRHNQLHSSFINFRLKVCDYS